MARYRGQKALYEAMSRASSRSQAKLTRGRSAQQQIEPPTEADRTHNGKMHWQPRAFQLHSGRVELTLPYSAIAVVSILFVLALVASFKLGQHGQPLARLASRQPPSPGAAQGTGGESEATDGTNEKVTSPAAGADSSSSWVRPGSTIVIQQFGKLEDLIPVRQYFNSKGIGTEIVRTDKAFYLFTVDRFSALSLKEGTREYRLQQRIVELGKEYRAPAGRESFAPNYFRGAYLKPLDENYNGEVIHVN
ncbi:MAG: hypothetical protein IH892_14620 [Planctomycetes bacterium]|nr:hypothetical protein [Planctomycetota bacterium]